MNNIRLAFTHALSPLHAGTGQGAGVIDLPIAREKATGLPFLPGSSLKGPLRARCNTPDDALPPRYSKQECGQLFGPDMTELQADASHASSVQFSDQRLLLLPIRSLAGTFTWVTSPYVLRRLARDIEDAQIAPLERPIPGTPPAKPIPVPDIQDVESCAIASNTSKITVVINDTRKTSDTFNVYLEDLEFTQVQNSEIAHEWATWLAERVFPRHTDWQEMLKERFCVVHDDVFNFLIDTATEVTARIKLKEDAKTVQDGGLWYEEALPAETILSGVVLAAPTKASNLDVQRVFEIIEALTDRTLQFGGKATVGRGLCRMILAGEKKKEG